jgi:DNA topoisomerase-1
MSAKETMRVAQELYEGVKIEGDNKALITYMRTDAVNLSEDAENSIRDLILREYGKSYLPSSPCRYKSKTRNAQEAHEAIRPVYFDYSPERVKPYLKQEQYELYQLIWNKTIASQMKPARYAATSVNIDINQVPFFVKGRVLKFDGFLRVYDDTDLDQGKEAGSKNTDLQLPPLTQGQELTVTEIVPERKFTKPPPRYTESSLVKFLEKNGIGRPSTYATIIETLLRRNYVLLQKSKFETTELGRSVCDWVRANFELVVDIGFTAKVEESLDEVAKGKMEWIKSVQDFYNPLREKIVKIQGFVEEDLDKKDLVCGKCGAELLVRSGKFGQFLGCSKYPECDYIRKPEKKSAHGTGLQCEKCGSEFVRRESKYGPYFLCSNYPECKNKKNRLSVAEARKYRDYLRDVARKNG